MFQSIDYLVLIFIGLNLIGGAVYLYVQARDYKDRKAYAFVSVASLTVSLSALRDQAASPEYKDDVELAALIERFVAAHDNACSALRRCNYIAVNRIVAGVEEELAEFRQVREQK